MKQIVEKDIDFVCKHEVNQNKINLLNKCLICEEAVEIKIIEDEDNILVLFLNGDKGSRVTIKFFDEYKQKYDEMDGEFGNNFSFLYITNHIVIVDNEQGVNPKEIDKIIVGE